MRSETSLKAALRLTLTALILVTAGAAAARAQMEWGEAELFFELNNTDGDLGIHSAIDGLPWRSLRIEAPGGRKLLEIRASSRLRSQGMTQLFLESAEPTFDDLTPEEFFARFPEGEYEISGVTSDGEEVESGVDISHVMAAPASNVTVNGSLVPDDCDEGPIPVVSIPVVADWDPVTTSHPDIGASGPVTIELYEFVLETDEVKLTAELPPSVTEFEIPSAFLALSDEWKLEIIVRTDTHNNTSVESCFEVD